MEQVACWGRGGGERRWKFLDVDCGSSGARIESHQHAAASQVNAQHSKAKHRARLGGQARPYQTARGYFVNFKAAKMDE
jgi:hypothetical protein